MYVNTKTSTIVRASAYDKSLLANTCYTYYVGKRYANDLKTYCMAPSPARKPGPFPAAPSAKPLPKKDQKNIVREAMSAISILIDISTVEMKLVHDNVILLQGCIADYQKRLAAPMSVVDSEDATMRAAVKTRLARMLEQQRALASCCTGMCKYENRSVVQTDGTFLNTRVLVISHCKSLASQIMTVNPDALILDRVDEIIAVCVRSMVCCNVIGLMLKNMTMVEAYRHPDIGVEMAKFLGAFAPICTPQAQGWTVAADNMFYMCGRICNDMLAYMPLPKDNMNEVIMKVISARIDEQHALEQKWQEDPARMKIMDDAIALLTASARAKATTPAAPKIETPVGDAAEKTEEKAEDEQKMKE